MGFIIGMALLAQHVGTEGQPKCRSLGHGENLAEFFIQSGDDDWVVVRSVDREGLTTVRAYPDYQLYGTRPSPTDPDTECYLLLRRKVDFPKPS